MTEVLAIEILTGLGCGALITTLGLTLWGSFQRMPGLERAVRATIWLARAFLLSGGLLSWSTDLAFSTIHPRLLLMATLAVSQSSTRRLSSSWRDITFYLPALILAGTALFWPFEPPPIEAGNLSSTLISLMVVACGGIGARALSESLNRVFTPSSHAAGSAQEWPAILTYSLLTLLASGVGMLNLWQRGVMWASSGYNQGIGIASDKKLTAVWLAWSAAMLGPRRQVRRRAGLIILAALSLITTALS